MVNIMYDLIQKVLNEMRMEKKDKVKHSNGTHTVIAYQCLNRANDVGYIRVHIYNTSDKNKRTVRDLEE
jgi:hypothetical protein